MPRLDSELVSRGIARSRERAKEMIKSGAVTVNGITAKKPSDNVSENDNIISTEKEIYVGRGALKLQKAAEAFGLDFSGKICIDIGASTGGFTEYMLMHGAEKVYAVDVGKGQLAEKLRNDSRVVNMENTDIRNVTEKDTGGQADFICADVSFISLEKILPDIYRLPSSSRALYALPVGVLIRPLAIV
jgi:23S rRNA (cytidine1920-2'-O)/16S rRNA (cytidine1409-2'-O)-methyltransferase